MTSLFCIGSQSQTRHQVYTRKNPNCSEGALPRWQWDTEGLAAGYLGLHAHTGEAPVLGSGLKMGMGLLWMLRLREVFCSHPSKALRVWEDEPRKSQPHGPISKLSGTSRTFHQPLSPVSALAMWIPQDVAQLRGPFPHCLLGLSPAPSHVRIFLI